MKLLLDTHIWVWSHLEPERLAKRVAVALVDPSNELWLSPVSVWEFLVVVHRRQLQFDTPWIRTACEAEEGDPLGLGREALATCVLSPMNSICRL